MSAKEQIVEMLNAKLAKVLAEQMAEHKPPMMNPANGINPIASQYDPNHMAIGRIALVNRVRGGVLQWRHLVSEAKGYKILDGKLTKMTPQEMRRRRIAARIGARKRKAEMSKIIRHRNISLNKRDTRLGIDQGE